MHILYTQRTKVQGAAKCPRFIVYDDKHIYFPENYNYLWQLLLKWGSDFDDMGNNFRRDKTILELEQRFDREDRQQRLFKE